MTDSKQAHVQTVDVHESDNVIHSILARDGCIVIENAIEWLQLRKLRSEIQLSLNNVPCCDGDFYGHNTKRVSSLVTTSEVCRQLVIAPKILGVMDEFLLRSCEQYQLNLTQVIAIGPDEPQQLLHPDDPMFPFNLDSGEKMINCMWAIDDFTKDNGATHLVPGSHTWEREGILPSRAPEPHEITQGTMKAGSVLIYFASLLHGGGANKTDKPRTGLVTSYCLGWLRQSENQYLAVPRELAEIFPERLQRLIGYFVHKPNLGQVDGRDPIELLRNNGIEKLAFEEFLPDAVRPLLHEHRKRIGAC